MPSLKAHFDGSSIVLDEPMALAAGQVVQVVQVWVDSPPGQLRFADRIMLPEFSSLPRISADSTRDISADRDAADHSP